MVATRELEESKFQKAELKLDLFKDITHLCVPINGPAILSFFAGVSVEE